MLAFILAEEPLQANGGLGGRPHYVYEGSPSSRSSLSPVDCRLSTSVMMRSVITHLPEEVERQHHLQGSRPDHVDVGDEVHEALGVHGHQVDHLSHRGGAASRAADHQSLDDDNQSPPPPRCQSINTALFNQSGRTFLYTAPMMAVRSRIPETKQTWKYFCSTSDCRQVQKKSSEVKK